MDGSVGGIAITDMTNGPLLTRGLELLGILKEDAAQLGEEDQHQLQRAWELQHRLMASECVAQHTMFRKETRWPDYYYRGDYPKLDDADWHCFTRTRYDRESGKWAMEKAPVYRIIDGAFSGSTGCYGTGTARRFRCPAACLEWARERDRLPANRDEPAATDTSRRELENVRPLPASPVR